MAKHHFYILDINRQPVEVHQATWNAVMGMNALGEDVASFIVGDDLIGAECNVYTYFNGTSVEKMFVTCFPTGHCPFDFWDDRHYPTYEEAARGHAEVVAAARAIIINAEGNRRVEA